MADPVERVDAVIAWVDGADPAHQAKRYAVLHADEDRSTPTRIASATRRFSDNDELRYCVRSIRNHAPWIGTIWIVTDAQSPAAFDLDHAAETGIEIVDHRVIFRDHEVLLPTFNSLSIETMLWRIPGLAPLFLYFNDDMFLARETSRDDFFAGGRPILRGRWRRFDREGEVSFHDQNRRNAADTIGWDEPRYFAAAHVAHPMRTEIMAGLFAAHPAAFVANAKPRFRRRDQFWPIAAHDHAALRSGQALRFKAGEADWIHFSMAFCRSATPEELRERLQALASHQAALGCINFLERVEEKVPEVRDYLEAAAGPALTCERLRA